MLRDTAVSVPAMASGSGAHPFRMSAAAIVAASLALYAGAGADASRPAKRTHAPARCRWVIHVPPGVADKTADGATAPGEKGEGGISLKDTRLVS